MKYGNPTSSGKGVMSKVKVFFFERRSNFKVKVGKTSRSRSLGQKFWYPWTHGKVLSQGIHILNIKALPIVVH